MFHPLVSPHDPSTILVASDMSGSYITQDAGASWRMFNLRGVVRFFAFDPSQPKVIYADNGNLWRSRDSGDTWVLVSPLPSNIRAISMASDHSDETVLSATDFPGPFTAFSVDPANSNHLVAATGGDKAKLVESADGGAHWKLSCDLPEPIQQMWISAVPQNSLLLVSKHHVLEGWDGHLHNAAIPSEALAVSVGRAKSGMWTIYALSQDGIAISLDTGVSWNHSPLPGTGAQLRAVACSQLHPETAYVSYGQLRLDGQTWHGVARTRDSGRTWRLVWKESTDAAPNVQDAWVTATFGTDWGENPLDMAVADQDANRVLGTDFGRTLLSDDGGEHWHAAYARKTADGGWTSTGLDVTNAYGIHFDPFDSKRQFITYTDISLFRSETAGRSWLSSSTGIPKEWLNTAYWMQFDPEVRGLAWTVNSGTHDLPRPKMWRHTSTDQYQGGVCRSEDGGKTWMASSDGMPPTAATDIVLDPRSPRHHRTLYVTAFGRGVYKSVDDGRTWSASNEGIHQRSPLAWRMTLATDQRLYLILARRSENGTIGNNGDGALYQSIDGAATWHLLPLPAGVNGPTGIAADPLHPKRLYLSAWARATGDHGEGGGVYVSQDSGRHWTLSLNSDQHVYDVALDARLPGTVYAAGFESSAWVSRDFGQDWQRISGFNFKWGQRVIPDPEDVTKVYVTTFGGGVWHGTVTTRPAVLDIATPEMEPHL